MRDDLFYLTAAIEEAGKALTHDDIPVGAVIVKDGKVIASAHNHREKDCDASAHAEIRAIRKAGAALGHWNLSGCQLYVTLEPCAMCAGALVLSRVSELVYAAADPKGGALSLGLDILDNPKLNHRVKIRRNTELPEAGEILTKFFQQKRAGKAN